MQPYGLLNALARALSIGKRTWSGGRSVASDALAGRPAEAF